jgi:hypothetical protein
MEGESSPSTPPHSSGTRQVQSASTPEQPRRHDPGDDDTADRPGNDNTQGGHGPEKRRHLEQDEEPSDIPAPPPKCAKGNRGAKGAKGTKGSKGTKAKAKAKDPNVQPVTDQEVRRSGRNSTMACEFVESLPLPFHRSPLQQAC